MKRYQIPDSVEFRFRVLNGTDKRGFRISKFDGDEFLGTVADTRLTAINEQFRKGQLTKTVAREKVDLLVEDLYKLAGVRVARVSSTSDNEKWVEAEFKRQYRKRNTVRDKKAPLYLYLRAVKCLGELSIHSASEEDMQSAVNDKYPDHRQRAVAGALGVLLKWAGRHDVKINKYAKKRQTKVKHMPFDAIEQAINRIEDPAFRTLVRMAMYTGCRIGELFALTPGNLLNGRVIRVENQIDKEELLTEPKRGSVRTVAPFPQAVALYAQWMKDKSKVTHATRLRASRVFKSACRRAHSGNKAYWLTFHDLRHCFAIRSIELGVPMELVARNLGNDIKVCEEYYAGKVHTDVTLETTLALLAKEKPLKAASGE